MDLIENFLLINLVLLSIIVFLMKFNIFKNLLLYRVFIDFIYVNRNNVILVYILSLRFGLC